MPDSIWTPPKFKGPINQVLDYENPLTDSKLNSRLFSWYLPQFSDVNLVRKIIPSIPNGITSSAIAGRRSKLFNGTNQYVEEPNTSAWSTANKTFTVEIAFVFNQVALSNDQALVAKGGQGTSPGTGGFSIHNQASTTNFRILTKVSTGGNNVTAITATTPAAANVLDVRTIVFKTSTSVVNDNVTTVYTKGLFEGTVTGNASSFLYGDPTDSLSYGARQVPSTKFSFLNGHIFSVKVWERGLSANEIFDSYQDYITSSFKTLNFRPRQRVYAVGQAVAPSGDISGTSAITFSQTATLAGSGALAGNASLTLSQSGDLKGSAAAVGSSTLTFSQTGLVAGAGALVGTSSLLFAQTGTVTGSGALTGTAALTFAASTTLTGSGALTGASALTFSQSGDLKGSAAAAGSAALAFDATGTVGSGGALAGSAAVAFGSTATATGSGALAGSAGVAFGGSADLIGSGLLSGAVGLVVGASGELVGSGALVGVASLELTAAATIEDASPLSVPGHEYTAPNHKLHYTAYDDKLHYTAYDDRFHYTATED